MSKRTVRARANRECASGIPIDATVATFSSVTVTCADEGADEEELELVPGRAAESVSTSRSVHVRVLVLIQVRVQLTVTCVCGRAEQTSSLVKKSARTCVGHMLEEPSGGLVRTSVPCRKRSLPSSYSRTAERVLQRLHDF